MAEYNESICHSCLHSYVCEKFNEHRDSYNQKCHFYNDHFVPAADVAPVRHARWDENGRCSNCGGHAPFWCMASTYYKSPWCQECGAKMDLEG